MEPKHVNEFKNELRKWHNLSDKMDWWHREFSLWREEREADKPNIMQFKADEREWKDCPEIMKLYIQYERTFPNRKIKDNEKIAKYMGITPFYPAVMINISPNWKGRFSNYKGTALQDAFDVKHFKYVIEKYLTSCNRYSRWKYCLECGSEGNFLHAHIVAEINPKCSKSVMTHINKGNHTVELRKAWNNTQVKGIEGLLKGKYSIQRVMIRNREILEDKLNYLIEANKPDGHTNATDLGMVFGDY